MNNKKIEVVLPSMHKNQKEIFDDSTRFKVVVAGRRFGKSRLAAIYCINALLNGGNVWWVAPTYKLAKRVGWRMVYKALRPLSINGYATVNQSELTITLANGGEFSVRSADDPEKLVGEGLDAVVIDESGKVKEGAWAESIRPALADKRGSALLIGTPKGKNWFWQAYNAGLDPLRTDWKSWRFKTTDNPFIDVNEIEQARLQTPEITFKQEYEAEFLDDGGVVFRNISNCVTVPPLSHGEYVVGIDWGRVKDYTVLIAIEKKTKQMIAIDRFNTLSWTMQRNRVASFVNSLGKDKCVKILAENNSIGEPNIEELRKLGLSVEGFNTTAQSKKVVIENLANAFEIEDIGIVDDPVLISELENFEMSILPSGNIRFEAPSSMHDDSVIALALAYHEACQTPLIARVTRGYL